MKLSKNIAYYAMAMGLTGLSLFVSIPIMSKNMELSEFGLVSELILYSTIGATVVLFASNSFISVKYHKLDNLKFSEYFSTLFSFLIAVGTLSSIISLCIANLITENQFYIFFVPTIFLLATNVLIYSYLQTAEQAKQFFISKLILSIFDFSALVVFIYYTDLGHYSKLLSWNLGLLVSLVYLLTVTKNVIFIFFDIKKLYTIIKFCSVLIPHVVIGTLASNLDRTMFKFASSISEFAVYSATFTFVSISLLMVEPINKVFAPIIFKLLK